MADTFYLSTRSKLNRAVAAYLVSKGCGSVNDILPANTRKPKGYPNTTIRSITKPEVPLTGIRRVTVYVSIKGTATQDPEEPNPDRARIDFDARVAQTNDALMQGDGDSLLPTAEDITAAGRALAIPVDDSDAAKQFAANNADMADFTCEYWYDAGDGDGEPEKEGCSWEEILIFEAVCSAINLDAGPQYRYYMQFGARWRHNIGTGTDEVFGYLGDELWHTVVWNADTGEFSIDEEGCE